MTQEEKQLLLKDLCARLPYEVIVLVSSPHTTDPIRKKLNANLIFGFQKSVLTIKPYLRPMSSMTKEEKQEMSDGSSIAFEPAMNGISGYCPETMAWSAYNIDYCISHHLDYRGLIPMGLALEATEGMYKTE